MGGASRESETKNGASETKTHASETTTLLQNSTWRRTQKKPGRKTHGTIPLNILVSGVGGFDPM